MLDLYVVNSLNFDPFFYFFKKNWPENSILNFQENSYGNSILCYGSSDRNFSGNSNGISRSTDLNFGKKYHIPNYGYEALKMAISAREHVISPREICIQFVRGVAQLKKFGKEAKEEEERRRRREGEG